MKTFENYTYQYISFINGVKKLSEPYRFNESHLIEMTEKKFKTVFELVNDWNRVLGTVHTAPNYFYFVNVNP